MKNVKKAIWFIKQSLILDYKFFKVSRWNSLKKVNFLFIKYFLIFKHFFRRFKLGNDFCYFENKKLYYGSKFGMADFQSLLSRHQYLMQLAGIKDVDTVIDVGANVGFFSKLCRTVFPRAEIFAFEPISLVYNCLKNNFAEDEKIRIYNLAISDRSGESKMDFDEQNSGISSMSTEGKIGVKTITLDQFIQDHNIEQIDILKIDTEEHEACVLRGAPNTLSKTAYLFIEIQIEDNKNYTISSLLGLLSTDKYDFQLVGFRNYNDTSEGRMRVMDALFKNTKIIK